MKPFWFGALRESAAPTDTGAGVGAVVDVAAADASSKAPPATVIAGGHRLHLLAQKAVWLPERSALLIADAHIGKAITFRRLGVPVPHGTTSETLDTLSALIARHGARRVVFLGDFLHSRHAHAPSTMAAVVAWRRQHAHVHLLLVRGNHDDHAGDPPASLGFEVVDEPLHWDGLALCHHPRPRDRGYVLAGHLHPCIHVSGRAHDRLRLPCFHFGPQVGVLPAFGAFTGMAPVQHGRDDRIFAVADDRVLPLRAA